MLSIRPTDFNHDGKCRRKYLEALKKADQGSYEPLIFYMLKYGAKNLFKISEKVLFAPFPLFLQPLKLLYFSKYAQVLKVAKTRQNSLKITIFRDFKQILETKENNIHHLF